MAPINEPYSGYESVNLEDLFRDYSTDEDRYTYGDRVTVSDAVHEIWDGCTGTVDRYVAVDTVAVSLDMDPFDGELETLYHFAESSLSHIAEPEPKPAIERVRKTIDALRALADELEAGL